MNLVEQMNTNEDNNQIKLDPQISMTFCPPLNLSKINRIFIKLCITKRCHVKTEEMNMTFMISSRT